MICATSHLIPEKNPHGRPRVHDRDQIALDLIEWAKKPDSINLCKFCAYYEPIIPPNKMTLWAKESESFRHAYEAAKLYLGFRREEMLNNNKLHVKAYDLNATTYDFFLKEEKRLQAEFESKLKTEEAVTIDAAFNEKFDRFNKAIEIAQESSRALKSSEIKSRADAKS